MFVPTQLPKDPPPCLEPLIPANYIKSRNRTHIPDGRFNRPAEELQNAYGLPAAAPLNRHLPYAIRWTTLGDKFIPTMAASNLTVDVPGVERRAYSRIQYRRPGHQQLHPKDQLRGTIGYSAVKHWQTSIRCR